MAACCGPSKCIQARTGSTVLDSVVAQVERYKGRNGKYPVRLDDISPRYEDHMRYEFKAGCRECSLPEYRTDSFGYELEFRYENFGKVSCLHNNESESWICKGIY